jgi:hypothetical protein
VLRGPHDALSAAAETTSVTRTGEAGRRCFHGAPEVRAAELDTEEDLAFAHDGNAGVWKDQRTISRDIVGRDGDRLPRSPNRAGARREEAPQARTGSQEETYCLEGGAA